MIKVLTCKGGNESLSLLYDGKKNKRIVQTLLTPALTEFITKFDHYEYPHLINVRRR